MFTKPQARTRELLDKTELQYIRATFFRGTSDKDEQGVMNGSPSRLVSGKALSGNAPPDLRDLTAEQILAEMVKRESFEMAKGRNTSSHFVPLSASNKVSSGFGGGGGNLFTFEIDFIPFSMKLDDEVTLPGINSFVRLLPNLPRDIFPLFRGNPSEDEWFAYTGTGIYHPIA